MIKANELRIGNLVLGNGIGKVSTIAQEFKLEPFYIEVEDSEEMFTQYYEQEIAGITLTKEWLLKFGLKSFDSGYMRSYYSGDTGDEIYGRGFCVSIDDENNCYWCLTTVEYGDSDWRSILELKYVHQLQNLYFALTGEELTIKETVST